MAKRCRRYFSNDYCVPDKTDNNAYSNGTRAPVPILCPDRFLPRLQVIDNHRVPVTLITIFLHFQPDHLTAFGRELAFRDRPLISRGKECGLVRRHGRVESRTGKAGRKLVPFIRIRSGQRDRLPLQPDRGEVDLTAGMESVIQILVLDVDNDVNLRFFVLPKGRDGDVELTALEGLHERVGG